MSSRRHALSSPLVLPDLGRRRLLVATPKSLVRLTPIFVAEGPIFDLETTGRHAALERELLLLVECLIAIAKCR